MAKRTTLPMATLAPLVAVGYSRIAKPMMDGDRVWMVHMTGYDIRDGKWKPRVLLDTYLPIAAGYGISWLASQLGINKKLARAGVPMIRI